MNRKAFELSINMLVVIILGMVLLGVGVTIFYKAYDKAVDIQETVNSQTEEQLDRLLDDGSLLVVPFSSRDAKRGDNVIFNLGVSNELGATKNFRVLVVYRGSSAFENPEDDPLHPIQNGYDIEDLHNNMNFCGFGEPERCGHEWVLMLEDDKKFTLENNRRKYIPINILLPRTARNTAGNDLGLPKGQYVFNVYVCAQNETQPAACEFVQEGSDKIIANQYSTTKKLYVNVK